MYRGGGCPVPRHKAAFLASAPCRMLVDDRNEGTDMHTDAVVDQASKRPVLLVVGAGRGVGAATACRFGREGWRVGLVARGRDRLDALAQDVCAAGVTVASEAADIRDPAAVQRALRRLSDALGAADAVCFSPLPDVERIKPVLQTTPEDLAASLELSVMGAAATVAAVLPAMRRRGNGTLLFTTGSGALRPSPERAASAITTTAQTVYIQLLRQALAPERIHVAHIAIAGAIGSGERHEPDAIAEQLWKSAHHPDRGFVAVE